MLARTHDLGAITALGIVVATQPVKAYSLATVLVALVANQIGGIAPDIDQPTAPFWRNLPVGKFVGKIFGKMSGGHRFITHSIIGFCLMSFLAGMFLNFLHPLIPGIDIEVVWWAFIIGMFSHLVMDTFTKEGVPWLLPLPVKFGLPPIKAFRLTTGKWGERAVFVGLLIFNLCFYAISYQHFVEVAHSIT